MNNTRLAASLAGAIAAFYLGGCTTTGTAQVNARPAVYPQRTTTVVTSAPPPRPVVVARPVVVEEVMPETNDIYISGAANADIVFINGSTYIWAMGPDGHRHRHFYAHGDRRREVFLRRENLRSVAAHRPAHAPVHPPVHASTHFAHHDVSRHASAASGHGMSHDHAHDQRMAGSEHPHHDDPRHAGGSGANRSPRQVSDERHGPRDKERHQPSV
ncbi:hypothetical protein P3T18_004856 [Paraburkholderia sp. GAS199]|uniref:hypothetical protein n=1 Tax=Paraburkholderia sp. GAS199 TaxID=3035126 RepID=UPI003D1BB477